MTAIDMTAIDMTAIPTDMTANDLTAVPVFLGLFRKNVDIISRKKGL